jgi:Na+-driven multidrug efflux pump
MITASIIKKTISIVLFLIIEGLVVTGTLYGAQFLGGSEKDKIEARKVTAVLSTILALVFIVVTIID